MSSVSGGISSLWPINRIWSNIFHISRRFRHYFSISLLNNMRLTRF